MISVVTLTYNNENYIEDFIANNQFADTIIIVTNTNLQLNKNEKITIIKSDITDFNNITPLIKTEISEGWLLLLKPTEKLTEALKTEIKSITSTSENLNYNINSKLRFMGKTLKHSGKNTLKNRLIYIEGNTTKVATLKHNLVTNYVSFDDYNQHLTLQAKTEANALAEKNIRPNVFHFLAKPFASLVNNYVFKLGFLDGKEGFIYSYLQAFKVFKRYLYLWLNYRNLE